MSNETSTVESNPNLKQCSACKKEIGKTVQTCPHCGTKQKGFSIVRLILISFGLYIMSRCMIQNVSNSNHDSKTDAQKEITVDKQKEITIAVGESIKTSKFEFSVLSVEMKSSIGNMFSLSSPAEGATYLAVHARMKNISREPVSIFARPTIKFFDSNGVEYSQDLGALGNFGGQINFDGKVMSNLNPGISQDLIAVFEVSSQILQSGNWKLVINADESIRIVSVRGSLTDAQQKLGMQSKKDGKSIEKLEKAAQQGEVEAQFRLGEMYNGNSGVPMDREKSIEWLEKAAQQGHAQAQYKLSVRYSLDRNYEKEIEWLEKAARQGHVKAQYSLGEMYSVFGENVPRDHKKAIEWLEKAAQQGDKEAQLALGIEYNGSYGVPADHKKAIAWLEKAAQQGDKQAQELSANLAQKIKDDK